MRWRSRRRSTNVEDRRRVRVSRKAAGGGIGIVVIALIAMYFGVDPSIFISQIGPTSSVSTQQTTRQISAAENELAEFVSVVLADTEDTWNALFSQMGKTYREPQLVLFSGAVQSACGFAQAAMGPFYCPADQKVYIDLSFYQDLKNRHGAPGDFAQAYVIAHEIGHHVQTLLGISEKVHSARRRVNQVEGNRLSVMQELQADCFAGVWAHHANRARQILEEGDIEEALGAASAIGDDRLQRKSGGYVTPDSFTHGSSAQRVRWFKQGLKSGEVLACNTFRADKL
ncbi:MAG: neutral zinc metallopeptidase [Desulfobacterales bacterium]